MCVLCVCKASYVEETLRTYECVCATNIQTMGLNTVYAYALYIRVMGRSNPVMAERLVHVHVQF